MSDVICDKTCPAYGAVCGGDGSGECYSPALRDLALRERRMAEAVDDAICYLKSGLAHETACPCHVCEGVRFLEAAKAGVGRPGHSRVAVVSGRGRGDRGGPAARDPGPVG